MEQIFRLYIRTGNDAFADNPAPELARILRSIADKIETEGEAPWAYQTVRDINGNDVGRYALKGEGE
jgi:hypothetical protein